MYCNNNLDHITNWHCDFGLFGLWRGARSFRFQKSKMIRVTITEQFPAILLFQLAFVVSSAKNDGLVGDREKVSRGWKETHF
jgi:hypothetical protein